MITQMMLEGMEDVKEDWQQDSPVDLPEVAKSSRLGSWLSTHADREGMKRFYVNGEILYSPWIKGAGCKFLVRHLIDPIRVILGLWEQQPYRIALTKKAAMAGISPGEYIALNRILVESDIAAVKFCKAYGLPASGSVVLSGKIMTCAHCQATLASLPCVLCWSGVEDDPAVNDMEKTPYELTLKEGKPTDCMPGSWGKVEVLAARLANGQHLWHPQDRTEITSMLEKLGAIIAD